MKKIPLTRGKFALVDDGDFEWLNQWKWCAHKDRNTFYVTRSPAIKMHRVILGLTKGDGVQCDHRNGNGLDNRRKNLRICTRSQNSHNRRVQIGASRYKGVCRADKKWQAQIRINNKRIYLGIFTHEIDAAKTYDKAARKYFGEFARTNRYKALSQKAGG